MKRQEIYIEAMHMDDYLQIDTNNNNLENENKKFSKEDLAFMFQLFQQASNNVIKESNLSVDKNSINAEKEETNLPKKLEGTVTKRKDGRWQGKYMDNGIRKSLYAKTQKEVIIKLNKAITERNKNQKALITHKNTTLSQWVVDWFKIFRESKVKISTKDDYQSNLINKVKNDPIGKMHLQKITALDIELFLQRITAPSAQARTYRQLKTCLKAAYNHKMIRENPMLVVEKISEPKSKKVWPSKDDFEKLFNYTKEQNYDMYLFIKFLSLTGLRKGEALALKWEDIKNDEIYVNKAYELHAKKIQTPKTDGSIRKVPILPEAKKILDELDKDGGNIFSKLYKDAVSHRLNIYNKRLGTNITLHTFRHYFTTECQEAGVSLKTINEWTGHTSSKVTIGSYTHTNPDFETKELEKLSKYRHNQGNN